MEQFLKNKAHLGVGVFIRDDNGYLIATLSYKESNYGLGGGKTSSSWPSRQAINFAIGIGARDIILEGDLANVIDKLGFEEEDNSCWELWWRKQY